MPRQYAKSLTATILVWSALLWSSAPAQSAANKIVQPDGGGRSAATRGQQQPGAGSAYLGKIVEDIEVPGIADRDREHLLQMIPQKVAEPLDRDQVRASIRQLYASGRFADIQAEVTPSGDGVVLTFTTSPNFFVGAVDVEGAPTRPNSNQIVNASKFQLGERFTPERLNRGLENVRQLMQENGYYKARVTVESTSNPTTQQVDVLFHVSSGPQARVGEVKVTGTSKLSPGDVQGIARMRPGDRVTAQRVSESLRRLRRRFQRENRALAQVEISDQTHRPENNVVDFTYQIDPGPVVMITTEGFRVSPRVLRKQIPVFEENAVDDDLLNEGKRNLLDYLQTRGHFDAKVEIRKVGDPETLRIIYDIDAGPVHKLALVEITGNQNFLDTARLRSYLRIEPATRVSRGRYSEALLKADVETLEGLYKSNGFREVRIQAKVEDNFQGRPNVLAVRIQIEEGERTRVGEVHVVGNKQVQDRDLPELSTQAGQPYSEQDLANDRERILSYYFDNGFPNASLDITTAPSVNQQNREDVTFTIAEGELFTVNQVLVGGTEHTRDYVVGRELEVRPGDPLSQRNLLNTQTRLYNLGIFSKVDTAVQNPEGNDPRKNVLVQLQEAKRYTFTYGLGMEFETGLPAGSTSPTGVTGVSPRVEFDVTRLNVGGRNQTITFQSHVGSLQQRGILSYTIPRFFDSDKFKTIYTVFYDNSLDVATFTSQRLEGKIDLRQQLGNAGTEPGSRPGPNSITYRFDFRIVKASHFAQNFSAGELALLSLPARVGGPGFTFIHDRRDNPLASTKGDYVTLDAFVAPSFFGTRSEAPPSTTAGTSTSFATNFARALGQYSTYHAFGGRHRTERQFVFARSTSLGLVQPFRGTRVLPPGSCPLNEAGEPTCSDFATVPLPEQFFAGGGNSHRGFGLNQAGPRDPSSGFPVGGTALFVNNLELRFPETSLPFAGPGFGFAIFHDMGNVFTAGHDMIRGLLRWHQPDTGPCLASGFATSPECTAFSNTGYDYTSHAVGLGLRYKTPIGPLRFDFGYNLNPTRYFENYQYTIPHTNPVQVVPVFATQRLRNLNVFFSIGQPF